MPETCDFAARLRSLREQAGLSVYALARVTGMSQSYLGRLERGEQQPSLDVARRLAEALGKRLRVWE